MSEKAEGKYITEDDIDNWPAESTAAERQVVIDEVEARVEKITKDYFYPKTFDIFLDGNDKNRLFLPIRQNILSINYMAIAEFEISTIDKTGSDITGSVGEYTITLKISATADYYKNNYLGIKDDSKKTDNLWGCKILGNTATDIEGKSIFSLEQSLPVTLEAADIVSIITNWDFDEDCIYRGKRVISSEPGVLKEPAEFFLDGRFPRGEGDVEIKGTIGYYVCPQAIKKACIVLARDENDPTLYEKYEFESESMGSVYSYSRGGEEYLSGIIECDRYLKRYVNRKPILIA